MSDHWKVNAKSCGRPVGPANGETVLIAPSDAGDIRPGEHRKTSTSISKAFGLTDSHEKLPLKQMGRADEHPR